MINSFLDIIFRKFLDPLFAFLGWVALVALLCCVAVVVYYLVRYRVNPRKFDRDRLAALPVRWPPADFVRWKLVDILDLPKRRGEFREYGLTLYCGRQGAGKTVAMVDYLRRMKERYPDCIIVANFKTIYADFQMESWEDFFQYRNDTKGVIFAIDEIHSEYSASSWKDFPESLLSEISQQRKQRIKIVATAQVFSRVVKPIREQTFSVMLCRTIARRWTFCCEYDAGDYERYMEGGTKDKIRPIVKYSFVQSDNLRDSYDTYEKIQRMQKVRFIPRHERGGD